MYNEVIALIKQTKSVNQYGDWVITETARNVFAGLQSITQSEFYQAASVGLKPEIKFVIPDFLDYDNEKVIEYKEYGKETAERYTVIRTYRKNNTLELVCKRGVDE